MLKNELYLNRPCGVIRGSRQGNCPVSAAPSGTAVSVESAEKQMRETDRLGLQHQGIWEPYPNAQGDGYRIRAQLAVPHLEDVGRT